jgi:flagellum-specific peptidoglycan hydrolase FlgJ
VSKTSDFINLVVPGAQEVQRQTGMFASVTIAQAAWETGWGVCTPKDINTGVESYNLFGRKASENEPYVLARTWEVYNGQKVYINEKFKKFNSYVESILDRSSFLKLPWYQRACNATDPYDAARFLIDTGYPGYSYATDPNYVNGITSIMKTYNLTQYDLPKGQPEDQSQEEDEDNMPMKLPDYAWKMLYNYVGHAYNDDIITSWSWLQKILDKQLTASELAFLTAVIEGKRRGEVL